MSFDYFNTSHLAFGSKITKAFTQLDRLLTEGEKNLEDLFLIYQFYSQYIDKNYPAPFPTRPDAPVRAKELYDLLNDGNTLRAVYLDDEENLHVAVTLFKRISNRFTIAKGSTDLKEGYAFCLDSISNKNYSREIQFVENYSDGHGNFLFQFRIDEDKNINIVGKDSLSYYIPSNFDHISTMQKDEYVFLSSRLDRETDVHTATTYEAILLVGYCYPMDGDNPKQGSEHSDLHVTINGENVVENTGANCAQFCVVYLKPGDILRASCKRAFKIKYLSGETIPPAPPIDPPEPEVPVEVETATSQYTNNGSSWSDEYTLSDPTYGIISHTAPTAATDPRVRLNFKLNRAVKEGESYKIITGVYTTNGSGAGASGYVRLEMLDNNDNVLSTTTNMATAGMYDNVSMPVGTICIRITSTMYTRSISGSEYQLSASMNEIGEVE